MSNLNKSTLFPPERRCYSRASNLVAAVPVNLILLIIERQLHKVPHPRLLSLIQFPSLPEDISYPGTCVWWCWCCSRSIVGSLGLLVPRRSSTWLVVPNTPTCASSTSLVATISSASSASTALCCAMHCESTDFGCGIARTFSRYVTPYSKYQRPFSCNFYSFGLAIAIVTISDWGNIGSRLVPNDSLLGFHDRRHLLRVQDNVLFCGNLYGIGTISRATVSNTHVLAVSAFELP